MPVFPSVPGQAVPGRATPGVPLSSPLPPSPVAVPVAPFPSVPMPIAGFGYQQGDMAELWAQAAAFFQQRAVLRASQITTATTLPSAGTEENIVYDNIIEDPYDGWDPALSGYWFAPFSGWYQVTVVVWVAAPGATNTVLQPYVATVKSPGNAANGKALTAVVIPNAVAGAEATWNVFLAAGDGVAGAAAARNSASNMTTNLTPGQNSTLEIMWLA